MQRNLVALCVTLLLAAGAVAQEQGNPGQQQIDTLVQAQQVLAAAETAGAATHAPTLLEEARWRANFARENWTATKRETREQSRMRAAEALWAARAALAKAQWLSTNQAIRSIETDINRFGGRSALMLDEESPSLALERGANSRARIEYARTAIQQARDAGGQQFAAEDLRTAEANLGTAKKITARDSQNASADHLAYVAEMMARRAYYLARASGASQRLPALQVERTRLAQAEAERQALAERAQREQAERARLELQRQLEAEQANRSAQAEEVNRLRGQIEENRRLLNDRVEQDRAARAAVQQQLDEAIRRYETAIGSASQAEIEGLRRQVEDQQIALRAIQERERLNEQQLASEIEALRRELDNARTQGTTNAQALTERESDLVRRTQELDTLRRQRETELAQRAELERQQQAAIAEATRRRQEAEAQAQQLQQQVVAAQQQVEQARQQTAATQAELERARQEIAARDTETRRLRLQQELAAIAPTRADQRGLIVTLPGIFFDSGKSQLKPGARTSLTRIANQLKGETAVRIAVEGHTDSVGTEELNQSLSEARANAVRDFLAGAGVAADRVSASGFGESQPVASNNTASGRQQNRRVELVISQ